MVIPLVLEHARLVPVHCFYFHPIVWSAFLSHHLILGLKITSSGVPDHTRQSSIPYPPTLSLYSARILVTCLLKVSSTRI